MSGSVRFVCVVMLVLMFVSIATPVYAAGSACVGMSCHQDRSDKLGEPMSHDCCGTSLCADVPPATAEVKVSVAAPQPGAVLFAAATILPTATVAGQVPVVTHSPPIDTGSRLALLSTFLI